MLKEKKRPQLETWKITVQEKSDSTSKLFKLHETLEKRLLKKSNLSKLRLELEQTVLEQVLLNN